MEYIFWFEPMGQRLWYILQPRLHHPSMVGKQQLQRYYRRMYMGRGDKVAYQNESWLLREQWHGVLQPSRHEDQSNCDVLLVPMRWQQLLLQRRSWSSSFARQVARSGLPPLSLHPQWRERHARHHLGHLLPQRQHPRLLHHRPHRQDHFLIRSTHPLLRHCPRHFFGIVKDTS